MTEPQSFDMSDAPEPRRVRMHSRWGGYTCSDTSMPPVPQHEWRKYWPRVSGLKSLQEYQGGLIDWKDVRLLEGLARKPELLERLNATMDWSSKEAKALAKEVAQAARDAGGASEGARRGTEAHDVIEHFNYTGRAPGRIRYFVPGEGERREWAPLSDKHKTMLAAYVAKLVEKRLTPRPDLVERVVVNTRLTVAGRLDMVFERDGQIILGDLKTQSAPPGEYDHIGLATQMACYQSAEFMLDEDAWEWEPMPQMHRNAVVVWLPDAEPGKCETVTVDTRHGLRYLETSMEILSNRKEVGVVRAW